MTIHSQQKQISDAERVQINRQVKVELIEHLYQGCLPGTISGIPVGIAIFADFYNHTPLNLLIAWYVFYNLALVGLTALYYVYRRYQTAYSPDTWLASYSVVMTVCAITWGLCVFLIPDDIVRQYFAFIALFLIATGYATGTIGQFRLCLLTLTIIVVPLIVWCFMKQSFFYYLVGSFSMIYIFFMSGINRRSTEWFKDSLKLKLENTLVSYQANHDILTDLPNQRLLPQFIDAAIQQAIAQQQSFAVICFSLNRMEMINDSLGHQAGDSVVQTVALRLKHIAQSFFDKTGLDHQFVITISRKDTFNIIMLPIDPSQINLLRKLFTILDEPIYLQKQGVKLTASVGVTFYPSDADSSHSLLMNADSAMLRAKQYGGNRLEVYRKEINEQLPKQLEIETDLHDAIVKDQLRVYFQPLVEAKTGKIVGSEALIRWIHPVRGFISPANFIPLAEETGLIVPIGRWVLEQSCIQTKKWHDMGFNHLKVAVNLSGKQLLEDNILEVIAQVIKDTSYDPALLELEITETAMLDESVMMKIQEFSKMGLALAVDDFGTGYSGLSYLKRFSIDKLKIDQSFIRDIPGNNDSITIVSAIIAMAKELNINTLAEGVETVEQLGFLHKKGCDYIQGYYFSKPIPAEDFTKLLMENSGIISKELTTV